MRGRPWTTSNERRKTQPTNETSVAGNGRTRDDDDFSEWMNDEENFVHPCITNGWILGTHNTRVGFERGRNQYEWCSATSKL
mmetsp:Transcript_109700/g.224159  ORF Transcript_109700/g.224159 Transcript_109700/m.224159 type:complete len:82 (-) Transcript_109700:287-532(-)